MKILRVSRWRDWVFSGAVVVGLMLMGVEDAWVLVSGGVMVLLMLHEVRSAHVVDIIDLPFIVATVVSVILIRSGVVRTEIPWHGLVGVIGVGMITMVLLTALGRAIRGETRSSAKE